MSGEDKKIENAERLVRVEERVKHIDQKVENISKTLDKLALDLATLAGTINSLLFIKDQIAQHEIFIEKYQPFIEEQYSNKKDNKGRLKDFLYSFVIPQLITAIVLYLVLIWKQQQAIDQIIKSLK